MILDPLVRVTHIADAADELSCGMDCAAGGLHWVGRSGQMVAGRAFTIHHSAVSLTEGEPAPDLLHKRLPKRLPRTRRSRVRPAEPHGARVTPCVQATAVSQVY